MVKKKSRCVSKYPLVRKKEILTVICQRMKSNNFEISKNRYFSGSRRMCKKIKKSTNVIIQELNDLVKKKILLVGAEMI